MTTDLKGITSAGEPTAERPTVFPCQRDGCDHTIESYITTPDVRIHPTAQVRRAIDTDDGEKTVLSRFWFCKPACLEAFVEAAEAGERDETVVGEPEPPGTLNTDDEGV